MERGVACATITGSVKEAGKILAYVCGVLVLGALVAPPLYWGAMALADAGVLVVLRKFPFQKYFNRGVLIAAVALFWPLVRWLGIRGWRPAVFRADPLWKGRLFKGALLGAGAMALLGGVYVAAGFYRFEHLPEPGRVLSILAGAVVVGVLEEALFRGALTGLFERGMGSRAAWLAASGLFAVVHFLKPDPSVKVPEVGWTSGFALVPHSFHQFADPVLFWGGFGTLLTFGLVLGLAVRRTGSLWLSAGLHGGLVLVKELFSKSCERIAQYPPWVGPELQVGLAPVFMLLLAGLGVLLLTGGARSGDAPGVEAKGPETQP